MYKLYVWLAERNPSTYTALRAKLYKKDRLEKLFSTYRPNDPFIQQYLSDVNLVKTLYGDSAQFLIEKDVQSPLTAHAMQVLVKRGENRWIIEEIVRRCESGALSEKDALELLKINPEFSREKLIPLEATDIGIRLSQKLIPPAPEKSPTKMKPVVQSPMAMVAVGTWVSTAAGWGKIDKITDPETKTSLKSFDPEKQKPLLEITLRPKEGPERVKLDLRNLQLEFLRGTTLYQCNGCKGFITENQSYLTGKHNHFAHGGVHASLRILNSGKAIPLSQSPKYSDRPPKNEWGF